MEEGERADVLSVLRLLQRELDTVCPPGAPVVHAAEPAELLRSCVGRIRGLQPQAYAPATPGSPLRAVPLARSLHSSMRAVESTLPESTLPELLLLGECVDEELFFKQAELEVARCAASSASKKARHEAESSLAQSTRQVQNLARELRRANADSLQNAELARAALARAAAAEQEAAAYRAETQTARSSARRAAASVRGSSGSEGTHVTAASSSEALERGAVQRLQRELEAARSLAARAQRREKELECRLARSEAQLSGLRDSAHTQPEVRERELRALCQELARAETAARAELAAMRATPPEARFTAMQAELLEARGRVEDDSGLRRQLGRVALQHDALHQAEQQRGEQARRLAALTGEADEPAADALHAPFPPPPVAAPSPAAALAPAETRSASPLLPSPAPAERTLDEAMAALAHSRASLSPAVRGAPEAFTPAELSSEEEEGEEEEQSCSAEAVQRAEAALLAAEQEAARLEAQQVGARAAADMQAANAAYEAESARTACAAAAAATAALDAEDADMTPRLHRQLAAARAHAQEQAARAERSARDAAQAASVAAAVSAAATDAAAFGRATATAKALAAVRTAGAQRRYADFAAKCDSLQGQASKLAASLRSERGACSAARKELAALVSVLQANAFHADSAAAAERQLAALELADTEPDFPRPPPLPRARDLRIRALAAERDRLSSQLAHVQGMHEAVRTLAAQLSTALSELRLEVSSGHKLQVRPTPVARPGIFERVFA